MTAIAKAPAPINEVFDALSQKLANVHARWKIYNNIYSHSDKRIDMLNEASPGVFYHLQNLLIDDVVLGICKVNDPASTGPIKTLLLINC